MAGSRAIVAPSHTVVRATRARPKPGPPHAEGCVLIAAHYGHARVLLLYDSRIAASEFASDCCCFVMLPL